jgi:hypothetical protein
MKFIYIFTGFIFACLPVEAQDKDVFAGESNCRISNPYPQPNERATWSGGCVNGYAQGTGILQWYQDDSPTIRYEGELEQGQLHGHGITIGNNFRLAIIFVTRGVIETGSGTDMER